MPIAGTGYYPLCITGSTAGDDAAGIHSVPFLQWVIYHKADSAFIEDSYETRTLPRQIYQKK